MIDDGKQWHEPTEKVSRREWLHFIFIKFELVIVTHHVHAYMSSVHAVIAGRLRQARQRLRPTELDSEDVLPFCFVY